jgi:hypothetical protein
MSKSDQKEYFTLLYTALSEKMKNVGDLRDWMGTDLGKSFRAIGLIPPPALGRSQCLHLGQDLTAKRDAITSELNPKKTEYTALLRSAGNKNPVRMAQLNTDINTLTARLGSINTRLSEIMRDYQTKAGAFNPSDADHAAHFEKCFNTFYSNVSA